MTLKEFVPGFADSRFADATVEKPHRLDPSTRGVYDEKRKSLAVLLESPKSWKLVHAFGEEIVSK